MRTKAPYPPGKPYRATVSPKGQITIPAAILRHLGWAPGTTRLLLTRRGPHLELRRVDPIVSETASSPARLLAPDRQTGVPKGVRRA
jgi:AbrB family looped-hinge helix DNA binding protein